MTVVKQRLCVCDMALTLSLWCRVCLAEVYQDKDLLRQLDENKPQDPNKAEVPTCVLVVHVFLPFDSTLVSDFFVCFS